MSVNGIGSSNMMGPRMSTNLSVGRQGGGLTFGERVAAGMNNAAGAVAGGLGTVAGMVPGGSVVSAAVSSLSGVTSAGAGGQYQGMGVMAAGVTGVPTINTTVGGPGGAGMVAGGGASVGGGTGLESVLSSGGAAGSTTGAVAGDPTLNSMFAEQKKLLGLQAQMANEGNRFNAISNCMKARHDAQKTAINNVR